MIANLLQAAPVPMSTKLVNEEFDSLGTEPYRFSQAELSDLVRDLNLSKESSEIHASRLKEKNLRESGILATY